MARVNVDSQALSDSRFGILASLMGVGDPDYALGKMVRVWMQCIERESYVLSLPVVRTIFGNLRWFPKETNTETNKSHYSVPNTGLDGPELLVTAELAEPCEGGLRIKGTAGRIEYLAKKRATARKNGTYGGRPPKPTRKPMLVSVENPDRTYAETPPAPAPAPALNTPSPPKGDVVRTPRRKKESAELDPRFQRFWAEYPRKQNKPGAAKAFLTINPDNCLLDMILTGLRKHLHSSQWKKDEGKYIPYPATWLHRRSWEDILTVDKVTKPSEIVPLIDAPNTTPLFPIKVDHEAF